MAIQPTTKAKIMVFVIGISTVLSPVYADFSDMTRNVHGTFIVGGGTAPEYEGANVNQAIPLIIGQVSLGNRYLSVEGSTLRANILDVEGFEFGPVMYFGTGRSDDIDNHTVAALGEIDPAVELGAFAAYEWSGIGREDSAIRVAADFVQDVDDVYDGWRSSLNAGYSTGIGTRWSVGADASISLVSDKYANTFFSVDSEGASRSGLSTFTAQGGAESVGVSFNSSYTLNDKLSLVGVVNYQRLIGDAADSPIVDQEGDADQVVAGVGVGYSF